MQLDLKSRITKKQALSALLYDWHNSILLHHQNLDIGYFINQLHIYNSKKVLVVGAGTGRVALPLSDVAQITALDIDKGRLNRLLMKQPSIKVINIDIVNFETSIKFDTIIFPYSTLQYIPHHKIKSCFLSISKLLSPLGVIIFDISTNFNIKNESDWKEYVSADCLDLNDRITEYQKIENKNLQTIIYKKYLGSDGKVLLLTREKCLFYDKKFIENAINMASLVVKKIDVGYGTGQSTHRLIYHCQKEIYQKPI